MADSYMVCDFRGRLRPHSLQCFLTEMREPVSWTGKLPTDSTVE